MFKRLGSIVGRKRIVFYSALAILPFISCSSPLYTHTAWLTPPYPSRCQLKIASCDASSQWLLGSLLHYNIHSVCCMQSTMVFWLLVNSLRLLDYSGDSLVIETLFYTLCYFRSLADCQAVSVGVSNGYWNTYWNTNDRIKHQLDGIITSTVAVQRDYFKFT